MPLYAFLCRQCGRAHESPSRTITEPCPCGGSYRRDFRFNRASTFVPHFNHSVGKYVHNQAEFNTELRRASDRATAATGAEHNYVPVDAAEVAKTRANDDGLYEQAKRHRDLGWTQPTKRIIT